MVCKRVPVNEGELAEAVAEVSGNEFVGPGMRPGDVRRLGKKADLDEGQGMPEAAWGPEPRPLSIPKIISASSDDAIRTRLVW